MHYMSYEYFVPFTGIGGVLFPLPYIGSCCTTSILLESEAINHSFHIIFYLS